MDKEQIRSLMIQCLKQHFSLYNENHKVNVYFLKLNDVCINYRTDDDKVPILRDSTYFDIQLIGDTCYILDIELEKQNRGKGIGWGLYETIHQFAKDFGMKKVRQTPSGWTPQRKTRKDYLLERGYVPFGELEVELVFD